LAGARHSYTMQGFMPSAQRPPAIESVSVVQSMCSVPSSGFLKCQSAPKGKSPEQHTAKRTVPSGPTILVDVTTEFLLFPDYDDMDVSCTQMGLHVTEKQPQKHQHVCGDIPQCWRTEAQRYFKHPRQHLPEAAASRYVSSQLSESLQSRSISPDGRGKGPLCLDTEVFPHFRPLLEACEDYAQMSGSRFRNQTFEGLQTLARSMNSETSCKSSSIVEQEAARREAKRRAAPTVQEFAKRLRLGEKGLVEELEKAFHMQTAEGVRNAMMSTCRALDLWPPAKLPVRVPRDDCAYEDVSASLPIIAQRLHNDEAQRQEAEAQTGTKDPVRRRALMAAFLVDFASVHGVPVPDVPETFEAILEEFYAKVNMWELDELHTKVDMWEQRVEMSPGNPISGITCW